MFRVWGSGFMGSGFGFQLLRHASAVYTDTANGLLDKSWFQFPCYRNFKV